MSKRRPKDRSHWGDAAFKVMHEKAMSKPSARELLNDINLGGYREAEADLAARVEKVLEIIDDPHAHDDASSLARAVRRTLNGEDQP